LEILIKQKNRKKVVTLKFSFYKIRQNLKQKNKFLKIASKSLAQMIITFLNFLCKPTV